MIIIPIEMSIDKDDIFNSTSDDIESSIKEHIIIKIIESISSMLNDENFIEMVPSKDKTTFDVKVDIIIGAASKYTDAVSTTISNLLNLCTNQGVSQNESVSIISKATAPLSNALRTIDEEKTNETQLNEELNRILVERDIRTADRTNLINDNNLSNGIDCSVEAIDVFAHNGRTFTDTDMIDAFMNVIVHYGDVSPLPTASVQLMSMMESLVTPASAMPILVLDEEEPDTIVHNNEPEPHVPEEDDEIYDDDNDDRPISI